LLFGCTPTTTSGDDGLAGWKALSRAVNFLQVKKNPSGDDGLAGWKALSGAVNFLPDKENPSELTWSYSYNKEPSVIRHTADNSWIRALQFSFSARSNLAGQLICRIDQKDGMIFLMSFDVNKNEQQIILSYADFKPFGKAVGQIDPSKISQIYIVDLQGAEEDAQGNRIISLKNFAFHESLDLNASEEMQIPLVAFDSDGQILSLRRLLAYGTSGGRWCYLSDDLGNALPMKIVEAEENIDGVSAKIPHLVFKKEPKASLEILFWPVGETFKIRLSLDGQGKGIQKTVLQNGALLLNFELAKTRYHILEEYFQREAVVNWHDQLKKFSAGLIEAEQNPTLRQRAKAADQLLLSMLEFSQEAVRKISRDKVLANLEFGPEVLVPTPKKGLLTPGTRLQIELQETAFGVGMGQGFGFVRPKADPGKVDHYYSELRRIGFNLVSLPLYWDQIVDEKGNYTEWRNILRFDTLAELGYTMHAHGFVQSGMPDSAKRLKGADFLTVAQQHTTKVASDFFKRYGEKIIYWQAINEPSSNAFGGSAVEARVTLVSDLIKHFKTIVPSGQIVVNDYDWQRGLEADRPASTKMITGTLPFYRSLMKSQNPPDILALEWYPGARVERPEFRVDLAEPCMDLLDTSLYWDQFIALGRPLIFTESNFPGAMKESDQNGYAWGRWDKDAQAQAAEDTFWLALSKPEIYGWVWWSITDNEPWNREGGLYTAEGTEKPVLERLSTVISTLKRPQTLTVGKAGMLPLPLLPGKWKISLQNGLSWSIYRDRSGKISLLNDF
jgi:hypothetical protein